MPFKDLPDGQTQYRDENGNLVGEVKPELRSVDILCDIKNPNILIDFFSMSDKERDNVIYWLNKITGLNYNLCRSEKECDTSPMMLCLGDIVIMRQWDWRKNLYCGDK